MNLKFYLISAFSLLISASGIVKAQTTLFSENFNGGSHQFTLNTADMGSATNGENYWIVNNVYTGGTGTGVCMGLPIVPVTFDNTPTQPAGITGSPTSNYLHITSKIAVSGGLLNAGYFGPDGMCVTAHQNFFKMTADINTSSFSQVEVKFWWMGTGANSSWVEMYYSTDGGSTWTLAPAPANKLYRVVNWKQESVIAPEFVGKATFRIGFRLVNNSPADLITDLPEVGYSFDDFEIIGTSGAVTPTITTSFSPQSSYCSGAQITVPFTSTGTFNSGNTYKVQLSDASGSFSNPTEIGTLSSTGNSGSVNATIPVNTPVGSGYRVRVVSTNPPVTGTPNGADFAVATSETIPVTRTPAGATNLCGGNITLSIPGSYTGVQWTPGGQTTNSITVTAAGDYSVKANSSGGCQAQSEIISISGAEAPVANFTYEQPSGYKIVFTNTSVGGTSYLWNFGTATTTSVNPEFTFPFDNNYPVTLIATNECGSDTITITVAVKKFVGINELAASSKLEIYPSPAQSNLYLEFTSSITENATLSISNTLGQEVYNQVSKIGGSTNYVIPVSQLKSGIYFLTIRSEHGSVSSKFIKN